MNDSARRRTRRIQDKESEATTGDIHELPTIATCRPGGLPPRTGGRVTATTPFRKGRRRVPSDWTGDVSQRNAVITPEVTEGKTPYWVRIPPYEPLAISRDL
jgi:hypothetical protein